ncbi:MAG: arylsulfotransferase family protein [Solirubrobacteraceae bacterium]
MSRAQGATSLRGGHRKRWPAAGPSLPVLAVGAVAIFWMMPAARGATISPLPGTRDASAQTQISFLGVPASQIRDLSVLGSRSGAHTGHLQSYASALGASFLPTRPFTDGEHVTVSALLGPATNAHRATTSFQIARPDAYRLVPFATSTQTKPDLAQSFVSEPTLKPTTVAVTVHSPLASPGDVFMTFGHGYGQAGPMILDGSGNLMWFKPVPKGTAAMDFQVDSYEDKPVLVWWQGSIASLGIGFGADEIYDSSYRPIAQVTGGNGYKVGLHDVQITPAGSALVTTNTLVHADLSSAGGPRDGVLIDSILQEIDIKTGLVMFEWHAYGHVALWDSYSPRRSSTTQPWDYFHLNSVDQGPDGNLLISARNTSTVYDISATTGRVLWRIGGKYPSFKMGAGTGIAWQHDARWQPDHTITIFDDGATPQRHSQSRAIRLVIDWKHRAVHLVGRYIHTPALLAGSQGSEQILPNGDAFVGWGERPYFTEFTPTGQVVLDGHVPAPGQSYRAYKFPWTATPTNPPAIAVKSTGSATATVYASWNGATQVTKWRVLAGTTPTTLAPVATVAKNGFETAIPVQSAATRFEVQPLDINGRLLDSSPVATIDGPVLNGH